MKSLLLGAAIVVAPAPLSAQNSAPTGMAMSDMAMPPPSKRDATKPDAAMPGMAMSAAPAGPGDAPMAMGDGVSTAGSGTARLPAGDAMPMVMRHAGDWMLMAHGYALASATRQGGPRGADEAVVQSMAMLQASRPLSDRTALTLRGMVSADPLMGQRGYPNLFATGETAHGLALIDRQHPHDLFMELSGRIDVTVAPGGTVFLYAGLPGEPALGPSAFMHRGSARFDPEAPITHHWFDSTHITYGVVTAGWAAPHAQIEVSTFKGREPGEYRYDIDRPKLDSWSVRGTWNPSAAWSAEVSYGHLHSPEALHPDNNESRLIASASYSAHGIDLTAGYSRKAILPGRVLAAWLIEATWAVSPRHALFGRAETMRTDELFEREEQLGIAPPIADNAFRVAKFTAGYAYTLPLARDLAVALGAAASAYAKPMALDPTYGRHPHSVTLFAKLMLGR